jgi:putative ABC transport system substrate-binding protein
VGYLAAVSAAADAPRAEAFRQALRDLGYIEGQNLAITYRYESKMFDRLPELAAELGCRPGAIGVHGRDRPGRSRPRRQLAPTGGNRTGITNMASDLTAKRLQLLKEVLPRLSRVAVLWDPNGPGLSRNGKKARLRQDNSGFRSYPLK